MAPLDSTYSLDNLPHSIWIPRFSMNSECYHGSPVEMLEEVAQQMGPAAGVDDAITRLIHELLEQGLQIQMPTASEAPRNVRAALLILVLLLTGYAREVPQA